MDGTWQFRREGESETRKITVPLPWEAAFPELRDKPVTATYTRTVTIPSSWQNSRVRLHIGAADYYAEVSVNGFLVGTHEGGYLPFDFEIQEFLQPGDNEFQIKVTDGAPARTVTGEGDLTPERRALVGARPFPFTEIPHGKQSWYVTVGGIWQSVYLERCPETFVDNVFVRPDVARSGAAVRVRLAHPPLDPAGWSLRLAVTPPKGAPAVSPVEVPLSGAREATVNAALLLPEAALWDMDNPHLYSLSVELRQNNETVDVYETRFGMRSIEARDGLILLNGKPVFLAGALDQDFYPGTVYTPPSTAYLRDQFKKAKEMGLNMLRCHIKTPDPRYLDLCDEMGILVWYEIPNWAVLTKKSGARGREHLEMMLERDYNHASLLILSVMNESWGIDLTEKWQREWLVDMFDYAKRLDPTRLVCDNSACVGNYHVKSDLDDYHVYFSIPDHANRWAAWCKDFASRPAWTYSRYGDAQRTKKEPVLLSEFGNWGLPKLAPLRREHGGHDPWWFQTGAGSARPENCETRYKSYHFERIWGPYDRMAEASQEQEWLSLKYEIEAMRKYSAIVGYVITEFTDLHWEANGLLDMCRNPKVFHKRLAALQAQDLLIPDHSKTAYYTGEAFRLPVLLSRFSDRDLTGAVLHWNVDGFGALKGEIPVLANPPVGASPLGEVTFPVPGVGSAQTAVLRLRLLDTDGAVVNTNDETFAFYPQSTRQMGTKLPPVYVHDPLKLFPNATQVLSNAGVPLADRMGRGVVVLSSQADDALLGFARQGGAVLLLALDRESLPRNTVGIASVTRDKNGWWGDWCSGVNFFRPDGARTGGPWASLPQTKQFDFTFRRVIPRRVLVGWDFATEFDDVWAGLFLGWVRNPAAFAAGFKIGEGKVFATTFDLVKNANEDPVSLSMLGDLISFVASRKFAPKKAVEIVRADLPTVLLPTAEAGKGTTGGAAWRYSTTLPKEGWTTPSFDDSGWKTGRSGFGKGIEPAPSRTRWSGTDIYLRAVVPVPDSGISRAQIRLFHDDDAEIWVNGEPLLTRPGYVTDYEDIALSPDQIALFVPGENIVCVHCKNVAGPQYVDLGITAEVLTASAPAGTNETGNTDTNAAQTTMDTAKRQEGVLETTSIG